MPDPHFAALIRPMDLPRKRARVPGSDLSDSLLHSLADAFSKTIRGKDVWFDLSQAGWITPSEIVVLACSIRAAATAGAICVVRFPDQSKESLLRTLNEGYHFARALGGTSQTEEWHKRIRFENYFSFSSGSEELRETRQILPISWIDLHTFGYKEPPSDLYVEEPEFSPAYSRFVRALLNRHGFVAEDAVDDFLREVLREIGWNAILHSGKGKPGAFAAFAGQVFPDDHTLHFALADAGCGITSNLLKGYRLARQKGHVPDYGRQFSCAENAAVVRYALDPISTSRANFPSEYDVFSDRGLALVTEIVSETGSLTLISSGTAIEVGPGKQHPISLRMIPNSPPWTCVYGSLAARSVRSFKPLPSKNSGLEAEFKEADFYPAAVLLRRTNPPSIKYIRRLLRKRVMGSLFAIVDFGFLDKSNRTVENGIIALMRLFCYKCITVVNVRSHRVSPTRIWRGMQELKLQTPVTIRMMTAGANKVQEVHIPVEEGVSERTKFDWKTFFLEDRSTCEMHFVANTIFLENSFDNAGSKHGFFKGCVHLLSGSCADKYFSLIAHAQAERGDNLLRWSDAFGRLLDVVMPDAHTARSKIIGFAASMRPILSSVDKSHPIRDRVYCLLSYDALSKAELAEIVDAGDEIVLCTDVISTGSLLREIVTLVRRLGARVSGIIALVDARETPSDTWETVFEPEVEGVPLYLGASLHRKVDPAIGRSCEQYWVDPVSAVPSSTQPESSTNLGKVLSAVSLLCDARAASIGHFVSGLRHTSVKINMFRLLSLRERISNITQKELQAQLQIEEWRTFRPRVALVPAGINRIDKVSVAIDDGGGKPSSEIYAEVVCGIFQQPPQIISVPRVFEPGGQGRCASLSNIGVLYDVSDIVVVDDGISSGGTVRSLIHQALRSGAKRILICALLARTTPEELDQWELTREVGDQSISKHALVSLIHPLDLPIPFSGENECPQCTTLKFIGSRGDARAKLTGAWDGIQRELKAPYVYQPSGDADSYIATWVRVYALAELASRSVEAFDELRSFLGSVKDNSIESHVRREAIVRLFLIEWRLLGRARLRQVIRPLVRELVYLQLGSIRTDESRFIEALSLVRSMFPDDYTKIVGDYCPRIVQSEIILDRVLFHLGTLDPALWGVERLNILRLLIDSVTSTGTLTDEQRLGRLKLLEGVAADIEQSVDETDIVLRIRALVLSLSGNVIVHDVTSTLSEIAKTTPRLLDDEETTKKYFGPLAKLIELTVIPSLKAEVYPLLGGLSELIRLQLQELGELEDLHWFYFDIGRGQVERSLDLDIQAILYACRNLSNGIKPRLALQMAQHRARDVLGRVLLPTSILRRVLDSLSALTISAILETIDGSLRGYLPDSEIFVEPVLCGNVGGYGADTRVLCPRAFVAQFVMLAKANLKKHVLEAGVADNTLRLSISAGITSSGQRDYVVFRVANSGPKPKDSATPRRRSRMLDDNLGIVDGQFVPVERGCNGYSAATSLKLRIY